MHHCAWLMDFFLETKITMAIFYFLLFCYLLDLITFGIEQAFQDLHSRRVLINTAAGLNRLAEMNAGQCPQLETFSQTQARFLFTPGEMPDADPKSMSLHESSHGNITESPKYSYEKESLFLQN